MISEQKAERVRGWKFGANAEASVYGIETSAQCPVASIQVCRIQISPGLSGLKFPEAFRDGFPDFIDFGPLVFPNCRKVGDELHHVGLREIGSGKERHFLRRHQYGHGPPSAARHHLGDRHIYVVDVRAFLAVDLDADEMFVQEGGHLLILERFVFHDMAPVASGVPDRQKNRFVQFGSLGEGFFSPRTPVDRVAGMLEQVGTALEDQAVEFLSAVLWQELDLFI